MKIWNYRLIKGKLALSRDTELPVKTKMKSRKKYRLHIYSRNKLSTKLEGEIFSKFNEWLRKFLKVRLDR